MKNKTFFHKGSQQSATLVKSYANKSKEQQNNFKQKTIFFRLKDRGIFVKLLEFLSKKHPRRTIIKCKLFQLKTIQKPL
jgi:hypothetical protein